jgi:hypothetical protein
LDPTDHQDRTRNGGISRPWRKSCWLAQRYDDTAGRPKRVHSKKEEHNCSVVGTRSKEEEWRPMSPKKTRLGSARLLVAVLSRTGETWELQQARATQPGLRRRRRRIRADMETSRLSRSTGDVSARQEMICLIRERRAAEEAKIDADRRELAELMERGSEYLSPGQIRRIVQCLEGTSEEPLAMLQGLDREIRQLVRDSPEA